MFGVDTLISCPIWTADGASTDRYRFGDSTTDMDL